MAKVSVIVPVYNVEKYIKKCIDSILSQTFGDIQVILVDDGSTDNSGSVCEQYKSDSRIEVIHKSNGGLSDARNAGMKYVMGDYVLFIDSDDYIDKEMVEILYRNAIEYDVDFSACGIYNEYKDRVVPQCEKMEEFKCSSEEAFGYILVGEKIPGTICNKLIKREIAEKLLFPVGKLYEDAFYTIDLMQNVKSVYVTTKPMYYYVHRSNSITTERYKKSSMDFIEAFEQTKEVVESKFPDSIKEAEFKLFWAYFSVFDRMLMENRYWEIAEYPKVRDFLKKNAMRIVKDQYFQKARKIGALALKVNVKIYRKLIMYNEKKNKQLL